MCSHPVTGVVSLDAPFENAGLKDCDGKETLLETINENGKSRLLFLAQNVPAVGYKIYKLEKGENKASVNVIASENSLENEYLSVKLDGDGNILSVFDKENGREVLSGVGNLLTISHDKPIHESAWNLENDYKMKMTELKAAKSVRVLESSPLRSVIETVRKYNQSTITQKIILNAASRTLDFDTTVDWHEREKVLKAEFPVNIRARYSTFEIAHGALQRPTYANNSYEKAMFECCAHKWTDLSEGDYGVSLLNDCKYGYDLFDNVMRITLMRGPICPDPKGDIGISTFKYSL